MNSKLSHAYYKTFRDAPSDAETISNQLMMRAGLLKKHAPGIFSYTPLMTRSIHKVTQHIREVFDEISWEECLMPSVIPAELWQETKRWDMFGDQLLKFKDRKKMDYCFGPTHEEVVTDLARYMLSSYKQLPFALYQIQTKFRDEIRPRFGVMRAREFIMMDGYSFHETSEDLDQHYKQVHDAYCRLFDRLQLKYRAVEADTGAIGGKDSHEFHVLADSGEDLILWCNRCNYAANVERAERRPEVKKEPVPEFGSMAEISTPGAVSIADVCKVLSIPPTRTMKAVVFQNPVSGELLGVCIRGDLEVLPTKITAKNGWPLIEAADEKILREKYGVEPGGYSPLSIKNINWIVDSSLVEGYAYVAGTGKKDFHLNNVVLGRDIQLPDMKHIDVAVAKEKDRCARCNDGKLQSSRGIEVGHIFKLGDKYSKAMNLNYLKADGKTAIPIMGTYGIGVTRLIAACIEQNHDKDGIKFPKSISPIDLHVILLQDQKESEAITKTLLAFGKKKKLHIVIDDRDLTPGVKLKDADLTGSPYQIVIGKGLSEGKLEFKNRMTGERENFSVSDLEKKLEQLC